MITAEVGMAAPVFASNKTPLIVAPGSVPTEKLENWRFKEVQPLVGLAGGVENGAVLSGVGGWAAIGLAEGLTKGSEGLGAVGLTSSLNDFTNLGGTLLVFALP